MAELLVSSSTGAMGAVLMKLAAMLSDECKALKNVRGDIKALKLELEAMHGFLEVMANVEELDHQAKLRVRDVRELSYDIEDNIDKFMVHIHHESSPKAEGLKLIGKCKRLTNSIKIRHQITKEIKNINSQVKEASERYARYKINEASYMTRKPVVDSRVVAIFKDVSELVGIDGPRDELIKWLKDEEGESPGQLKVVSIVGFGGLGKTTLANQVYNSLGANFDCRAFVPILRTPDITKVLGSILSQTTKKEDAIVTAITARDQHEVISKIRDFLKDKRYFIVIDDIWDAQTWEIIKYAFVTNSSGSRIIITTRVTGVAESCSSSHGLVYQIKPLSDIDSKKLFFKRIFSFKEECPADLIEASDEILKKCGGLPLAIISISSLLATRRTEKDLWDRVRRSVGFAFGESSDHLYTMRRILSLSYFELPYHLRSCLLYLATFPEDYEIERTRVVHGWIIEGFIHGEDGQDLIQLGDKCFHELINSSLVQPVRIGYDGKAKACRVHDTILDFLIHMSTEDNFCMLLSCHSKLLHCQDIKVRRLSVMADDSDGDANISPKQNNNTSHLRSLSVFMYRKQLLSCVMEFSSLRLLDLQGCRFLQNHHLKNIGRLSQLRYLNVSRTPITELPSEIGDLQCLEILNAEYTRMEVLPQDVTRLKRLERLHVKDTKLPDGIGNLKNLLDLNPINILTYSLNFVEELGELTNLRCLGIDWFTYQTEVDKACYNEKLMLSLRKLSKLQKLSITITFTTHESIRVHEFFPVLDCIHRVAVFVPKLCKGLREWLKSLVNLESLKICLYEPMEQEEFEFIGTIPGLLDLELSIQGGLSKTRQISIVRRGFQQLQRFGFRSTYYGAFVVHEGAMPMLKDLQLYINQYDFISPSGGFDFGIQHLSRLARIDAYFINKSDDTHGAFKSMVEAHPNRPTLTIR
uniref:NB-ARC domain-containing protein n=1 Tax=Oryza brachyantha TaxID=4533 RepID=J3N7F7_ORYBR